VSQIHILNKYCWDLRNYWARVVFFCVLTQFVFNYF
jgi:hypothetical protein